MNKKETIAKLAEVMGSTKKDAEAALNAVTTVITNALVEGQDVKITGFGTFSAVEVAERTGIIQMGDRKGETYTTPAHRAPKFKAASALKDAVR
jgi:DNA-binding protein HU-beta